MTWQETGQKDSQVPPVVTFHPFTPTQKKQDRTDSIWQIIKYMKRSAHVFKLIDLMLCMELYLLITSFILHPALIGLLCLTTSFNKQYNHSPPVLISSSPFYQLCWSIAFSNYPFPAGEWSNCLQCNYSGFCERGSLCAAKTSLQWIALFVLQKIMKVFDWPWRGRNIVRYERYDRGEERRICRGVSFTALPHMQITTSEEMLWKCLYF